MAPNKVQSRLGEIGLQTAIYRCEGDEKCSERTRPRRLELSLAGKSLTEGAERLMVQLAAEMSFKRATELLSEIWGMPVSAKRVERAAKRLGEELAEDEQRRSSRESTLAEEASDCMEIDGTGIPMRPEATAGRAGKAADGQAKTREVKLAMCYKIDDESVTPHYTAGIEPVNRKSATTEGEAIFQDRVARGARRTGYDSAERQVMVSDGAAWIYRMFDILFPESTKIMDYCHVSQHVYEACETHYRGDRKRAEAKHEELKKKLKNGQVDAVINCLRQFDGSATVVAYLIKNKDRMDYPSYQARGLPITSSRIESACKNVIGSRFKRGGMRWSLDGARKMLALRCRCLSGELDDWYERRRTENQAMAKTWSASCPALT